MKIRNLLPPLSVIESDLFGREESCLSCADAAPLAPPFHQVTTVDVPGFIEDAIRRRDEAGQQDPRSPVAGDVRQLNGIWDVTGNQIRSLSRPVAFLLDQSATAPNVWTGWLVSPEVDYATCWDVLLEADTDEPFDPLAGMVQLWNPVTVWLPPDAAVLARFTPDRLSAIRNAASEFPRHGFPDTARPGLVAPRNIAGTTLLTGTPLGSEGDPRRVYQGFYLQLARELDVSPTAGKVVPLLQGRGQGTKRSWWMAVAASVIVAQAALLVNQTWFTSNAPSTQVADGRNTSIADENVGIRAGIESRPQSGNSSASAVAISFKLRDDAKPTDLDRVLRELNIQMLMLDSEPGRYFVMVKGHNVATVRQMLNTVAVDIRQTQ